MHGVDRDEPRILQHLDLTVAWVLLNQHSEEAGLLPKLLGELSFVLDDILDDASEYGDLEAWPHVKDERVDVISRPEPEVICTVVQAQTELLVTDDEEIELLSNRLPGVLVALDDALDNQVNLCIVFRVLHD